MKAFFPTRHSTNACSLILRSRRTQLRLWLTPEVHFEAIAHASGLDLDAGGARGDPGQRGPGPNCANHRACPAGGAHGEGAHLHRLAHRAAGDESAPLNGSLLLQNTPERHDGLRIIVFSPCTPRHPVISPHTCRPCGRPCGARPRSKTPKHLITSMHCSYLFLEATRKPRHAHLTC